MIKARREETCENPNRATAKADKLVYDLVWEIIEQQQAEGTVTYYDDLTREELEAQFYPTEIGGIGHRQKGR